MRVKFILPVAGLMFLAAACTPQREIAYVKDAARDSAVAIEGLFSKGIQADDLLYIYVESQTPQATIAFNQETNKSVVATNGVVINSGNAAVQGYRVNQDGYITFPALGKLKVLGMTHAELAKMLEDRLVAEGHLLDPVVTVKLVNFRVCVLGDVARPGQVMVKGERLTIFEALSMVGDLTIYGQRENVTVIREENGQRTIGTLDLTSQDVFSSPYYYLHQNDVVYVEPNKRKKVNADRDPMIMTYISSGLSVLSVLSSMFYYYTLSKYYQNRN